MRYEKINELSSELRRNRNYLRNASMHIDLYFPVRILPRKIFLCRSDGVWQTRVFREIINEGRLDRLRRPLTSSEREPSRYLRQRRILRRTC